MIETYKGERLSVPRLPSGCCGGCGIPPIAGAYCVVFQNQQNTSIGFCNAAGPYPPSYPYKDRYPRSIAPFLESLRRASRDRNAKLDERPEGAF